MRQLFCILGISVLFAATVYAVQVDGYCFLDNQISHEGSKVLFLANSPSAVTDSIYTDSNGYFQIDIYPGIYDIVYSHPGYFDEEFDNQFINSTMTLATTTLISIIAEVSGYAYLERSTNHEGIIVSFYYLGAFVDFTSTDSTGYYQITLNTNVIDIYFYYSNYDEILLENQYLHGIINLPEVTLLMTPIPTMGELNGVFNAGRYSINGDIYIEAGDSLILEPGVLFLFNGYYNFTINGYLSAIGTVDDSIYLQPINSTGIYKSIKFNYNFVQNINNELRYCKIEGAYESGIRCDFSSIAMFNCTITQNHSNFGGGIYCSNSTVYISSSNITQNTADSSGGGIYCIDAQNFVIENCDVTQNYAEDEGGGYQILNSSNVSIQNCIVNDNIANNGGGINLKYSNSVIKQTVISNNSTSSTGGGIRCLYSNPLIQNCSIIENTDGMHIINSDPIVKNCIFEGNNPYGIYISYSSNPLLSYCDFFNNWGGNFQGQLPQYIGQLITINVNGDSCDTYINIFENPLFVDPINRDYHLLQNSPCIDAGDPENPFDPDNTIADIGAYYYEQSNNINSDNDNKFLPVNIIFPPRPNPTNLMVNLPFYISKECKVRISIYNILGEELIILLDSYLNKGFYEKKFFFENLSTGIYFVSFTSNYESQIQKIILLK